jgi:hypothetical protein
MVTRGLAGAAKRPAFSEAHHASVRENFHTAETDFEEQIESNSVAVI